MIRFFYTRKLMFTTSIPPGYGPELGTILTQKYREISPLFEELPKHLYPTDIAFAFKWIDTKPNDKTIKSIKNILNNRKSEPIESIQKKCRAILNRCSNLMEKVATQSIIKAFTHHIDQPDEAFCKAVMTYFTSRKSQLRLHEENYLHTGSTLTLKEFILSRTIIESPSEESNYMRDITIPYFCAHPDLRPIMQAYAKILSTQKGNIFVLNEFPEKSKGSLGYYSWCHSIFLKKISCIRRGSVLIHECLHAIMNHIYYNNCLPYDFNTKSSLILNLNKDPKIWTSLNTLNLNKSEKETLRLFKDELIDDPAYFNNGYDSRNSDHAKTLHVESIVRIMEARAQGISFSTIEKIAPSFFRHYTDYCRTDIITWNRERKFQAGFSNPLIIKNIISNLMLKIRVEKNLFIKRNLLKMVVELIHANSDIDIESVPDFRYILEYFLDASTSHVSLELLHQLSESLRSSKHKEAVFHRINMVIREQKINDFLQKYTVHILAVAVLFQIYAVFHFAKTKLD